MKILATRTWNPSEKAEISAAIKDATFLEPGPDGKIDDLVNEADVLFGFPSIPLAQLVMSPTLRLLHVPSTGVDRFVSPEMLASRITLTNSRGVHAKPVAEHALALMLALAYKLPQFGRSQARRTWEDAGIERIEGQTAGLLGLGAIGEEIARKCKPFDMRVIGTRRDTSQASPNVDEVFAPEDTNEVLHRSDFVLCSLPLTKETEHFLDYGRFCAMKSTAYFINVGRGPVVLEEDLVRALKQGQIKGAGLDVFEHEPLPADSALWGMENVIITPHAAGNNKANPGRVLAILVENLRRMEAGQPLVNVVDMGLGY